MSNGARHLRWLILILLLAGLPTLQPRSQSGFPPELKDVANESRGRLCALYSVSPELCAAPISVQFAATTAQIPEEWRAVPVYAAGLASPPSSRILIVLSRCGPYPFGDPEQTLRHELSHVLLYRSLGFEPPRWLDEGLAMRAAGEWGFSDEVYAAMALPSVARGRWKLDRVEGDFAGGESDVRRSYALAKGFVRDLFKDDAGVTQFLLEARQDRSVKKAFVARFGVTPDAAFSAWARNLPWWGEWLVVLTSPSILWLAVTLLAVLAFLAAIRRRRIKYEQLPD
jgi:hypothetical protein